MDQDFEDSKAQNRKNHKQQSDDEEEVYEEVLSEDYIQEDTSKKIPTNSNNNNSKLSQKADNNRKNLHQFNMKSSESEEGQGAFQEEELNDYEESYDNQHHATKNKQKSAEKASDQVKENSEVRQSTSKKNPQQRPSNGAGKRQSRPSGNKEISQEPLELETDPLVGEEPQGPPLHENFRDHIRTVSSGKNSKNGGSPPGGKSSKAANAIYSQQQQIPKPGGNGSSRPQTQQKGSASRVNHMNNKQLFKGVAKAYSKKENVTSSGRAVSQHHQRQNIAGPSQGVVSMSQQQANLQFQVPMSQTQNNFYQSQPNPANFDPQTASNLAYASAQQLNHPKRNSEKPPHPMMLNTYTGINQSYKKNGSQLQNSADKADSGRGRRQVITNILRMQGANSAQEIAFLPGQQYGNSASNGYVMTNNGQIPLMSQYVSSQSVNTGALINNTEQSPLLKAGHNILLSREQSSMMVNNPASLMQIKRKRIKELLLAGGIMANGQAKQQININGIEKEDLQQQKRSLKLQVNVTKDENTRLKTKMAILQQEMDRKDKDIELLSLKLHQQAVVAQHREVGHNQTSNTQNTVSILGGGASTLGSGSNTGGAMFESYLVGALKKQYRDTKQELEEKKEIIEKLRREMKLTKTHEIENELQSYIEECQRLRTMLESTVLQNKQLQIIATTYTQQLLSIGITPTVGNGYPSVQNYVIQEESPMMAESEAISSNIISEQQDLLQKEINLRLSLQQELMNERHLREKFQKKLSLADLRLKKFTQLQQDNQRKTKLVIDKTSEVMRLREELEGIRDKAKERDHFNNKNKELVTKYYGQTSAMSEKDKRIEELKKENQKLQDQLREKINQKLQTQSSGIQQSYGNPPKSSQSPNRGNLDLMSKRQGLGARSGVATGAGSGTTVNQVHNPIYSAYQAELIFRSLKKQPLSNTSDPLPLKSYLNSHQEEIKKEVADISKKCQDQTMKQQAINRLTRKLDTLTAYKEASFKGYTELEKFVEVTLGIPEKDFKKMVIFGLLVPSIKSLNEIPISSLIDLASNKEDQVKKNNDLEEVQHEQEVQAQQLPTKLQQSQPSGRITENPSELEKSSKQGRQSSMMRHSEITHPQMNSTRIQKESQASNYNNNNDKEYEDDFDNNQLGGGQSFAPNVAAFGTTQSEIHQAPTFARESANLDNHEDDEVQQRGQNEEEDYDQNEFDDGQERDGMQANNSIQITEDQMLDIAETVFQAIADRLKASNTSVKKVFGKKCQIVEEFEGEANCVIIQASDFLDALKNPPLSISELSELEVACLMRVLSKPEIDHAILLQELNLVLENFGIQPATEENDPETLKEEVEKKKQKQTKKKQIKLFIQSKDQNPEAQAVFELMRAYLERFGFSLEQALNIFDQVKYEQLVKSKKKEVKLELLKSNDFLEVISQVVGIDLAKQEEEDSLNGIICELLIQLNLLDPKYTDVLQLKNVQQLLEEVLAAHNQDELDRKVLEDFYKPSSANPQKSNKKKRLKATEEGKRENSTSEKQLNSKQEVGGVSSEQVLALESQVSSSPTKENVEVLNFEELMSRDEQMSPDDDGGEYGDGEQYQSNHRGPMGTTINTGTELNEIAEVDAVNEEQNSPLNPRRRSMQREGEALNEDAE